jgi:uncharacterized lipoprotein YddW (UPF0748 family)
MSISVGSRVFALVLLLVTLSLNPVFAQPRTEYRAFWVDTFNTVLNTPADVTTVVNNAKAAKANALFVQVRRRGDSWYLNSLEPMGDRTPIQPGFDPLQDIITKAHAEGIEVHAFVIMSAVWGRAPNLFPPENPNHVFNQHGGYNSVTNTITPGPNNWLTRTLIPDGTASITYQGHRFGSDFWVDFGHPAAADYTVNVIKHLVANYNIDGLHLDRIRYPEIGITGQTPSSGTNVGYNFTSVERFNNYHGKTGNPAINDPLWSQWRRDQVTNIVRRVYLESLAIKPQLKISGAYIAFGGIGSTEASWNSAEAYWRVYQDWRAWTQEGITDIAIPMVYKAEHTASIRPQYDQWDAWLRTHLYNRAGMMGQGAANNAIEGTLRQTRRTLTPGTNLSGIIFYSMATSNIAVTNNPFAIPSPVTTPARPFAEFASGLTTGKSVNGATLYEPAGLTPIFSEPATIPTFSWKTAPTKGHLKGFARRADATPLDTANVTMSSLDGGDTRSGKTDGNGFYGGVDLASGSYLVKAVLGQDTLYSCVANVSPGIVTTADLAPETTAPQTTATVSPAAPNGENGWYTTDVTMSLSATDDCSGVAKTEYSIDNGETWIPYSGELSFTNEGVFMVQFRSVDRAGNVETAGSTTIKIDKTAPTLSTTADPTRIWPPNGKMVDVTISGSGTDAISGLASVSYAVTDEYGTPLSIAPRTLTGNSATWADVLAVEARRDGEDRDGRLYRITITVKDAAGHSTTSTVDVVVVHDNRK